MKAESYIFLDIDGVLNSKRTHSIQPYGCSGIGGAQLAVLKEIVDLTHGKIVLISDWRLSFLPDDHMPEMGKYIRNRLNKVGLQFELVSLNHRYENRTMEIAKWIRLHPTNGYIILDDDVWPGYDLPEVYPHWIHTDWKKGLLLKHVDEAVMKMQEPVKEIPMEDE